MSYKRELPGLPKRAVEFTLEVLDLAISVILLFTKLLPLRPGVTRGGFLILQDYSSASFKCSPQVSCHLPLARV
jgi:hypothetical protein